MKINRRWGFKFYYDETKAKACYYAQMIASKHGIAPQVGHFTKCLHPTIKNGNRIRYGYLTEHALVKIDEKISKSVPQIKELLQTYHSLFGYRFTDFGCLNIGYLNGRYVIIDFDGIYRNSELYHCPVSYKMIRNI